MQSSICKIYIGIFFLERKKPLIYKQNNSAEVKTSDFVLIKVREKKSHNMSHASLDNSNHFRAPLFEV